VKIYYGVQTGVGGQTIWVINLDTMAKTALPHIIRHSPDGFQWGYGGSGPSDTALGILTDCAPDKAERWYQAFKWDFLITTGDVLCIPEAAIKEWLRKKQREEMAEVLSTAPDWKSGSAEKKE